MGENLFNLFSHKEPVGYIAQNAQRKFIMHNVFHLYATVNGFEKMLVVPVHIRTGKLGVYKMVRCIDGSNFYNPIHGDSGQGFHGVLNDLTRIHFAFGTGVDNKSHFRWSDFGQVLRSGEKLPGFLQRNGKQLFAMKSVHGHVSSPGY
jgi:hypothetical protein